MILGNILVLALCFVGEVLGGSSQAYPSRDTGLAEKSYIVTLKDSVSKGAALSNLRTARKAARIADTKIEEWDHAIHGFSARLTEEEVARLRQSSGVIDVEEDGTMHAFASQTQTNAPWGLARLSSKTALPSTNPSALNYTFTYDSSAGAGVDIYVLDTGIRFTHQEFGGRARNGAVFGGYNPVDGIGHGTHCAGTAGGSRVGVAKRANLISVRVLSDTGSGSTSQVISGVNWIGTAAATSGRPSVVLIALGGGASTALDSAVTALLNSGIHVVVAAGSSNAGTETSSPGRVPGVILVAASSILDARAPFTNYGSAIDVFAPGVNIYSSWYTSDTAYNTLSGNSMAAAHVAGVVAYLIGLEGNLSPAAMETKVKGRALVGVLTNIPSGTANRLAQI